MQKLPDFEISGICHNALEAFTVLSKEPIDLLLLDINMPEITGMELLRSLKNPPKIIFTTADSEYALQSYEINALDYLMKPITFDRFVKALHKFPHSGNSPSRSSSVIEREKAILFVKSGGKMVKIAIEQLWFVEGYKNYVRLWIADKKIIVHNTMQRIEAELKPFSFFVRISKSSIINLNYVSEIDANHVRINNELLAIGNTYKLQVLEILDKYKFL